jgi:hypothetical protein
LTTAELASGVEHRVDHLERVLAGRVPADRNATAVVLDDNRAIRGDRHVDSRGVPGHRFVDGVVDDLPDEVMEAAGVRRADVHAGSATDGFQALEDLDARRRVVVPGHRRPAASTRLGGRRRRHALGLPGLLAHAALPTRRSYRRSRSSSL